MAGLSWIYTTVIIIVGVLTGKNQDFSLVYKAIQKEKGFATQAEAHQWLKQNNLTAHHFSSTQIQLIPSDLHNNLPHIGAASDLRKMGNNLKLKEIDKMFENYGILGISIG